MKKWMESAPWRCGNNNGDSNHDDFVGLIEEASSQYYDFSQETEKENKGTTTDREQMAAFAQLMHDAEIGEMTATKWGFAIGNK